MVCENCFQDIEIQLFIQENSNGMGTCDSCFSTDSNLIELTEILDFFVEFLGLFQANENGVQLNELIQRDWDLFKDNQVAASILEVVIGDELVSDLENYSSKVDYLPEIKECISYWSVLKDDLKWKRRFLTDIDSIIELGWDSFFEQQSILGKDEVLYRARIHKEDGKECYGKELMGSPPKKHATGGRANPRGIPYLYLSKDIRTTFYETRVTFLDEVSVASFKPKKGKEIILIDFTENNSLFLNMDNILQFSKARLLKRLISEDLSLPIRRYDSELEYIPTQFICEFIRYVTGARGILFGSSLFSEGLNVVLFDQEDVECLNVEKYRISNVHIEGEKI